MSYTLATVKGKYQDPSGNAATGQVHWFPTAPIVDSLNHITITPPSDPIQLDATGLFTAELLPMDTDSLSSFVWAFRPNIAGVPGNIQYLTVNLAEMPEGGWWIDQLPTATP